MLKSSRNYFKEFFAQGSVEYLIPISIVIVMGLVVTGIVSVTVDNSVVQLSSSEIKLANALEYFGLGDSAFIGDNSLLISLSNNLSEKVVITMLTIGNSNNFYDYSLFSFDKKTFLLKDYSLSCTCGEGDKTKTCPLVIDYTSLYGLSKRVGTTITIPCNISGAADLSSVIMPVSRKPILAELTPVSTPDNNSSPEYIFTSSAKGEVMYFGSCLGSLENAVEGSNSTILKLQNGNVLVDGNYSDCKILIKPELGESSDTLNISPFVVDLTSPVLSVDSPNNNDYYKEMTEIEFSASDNESLDKVEICDSSASVVYWEGEEQYSEGKFGTMSAHFDGSNNVKVSNRSTYNFGQSDFTIAGWFLFEKNNVGYQIILDGRSNNEYHGWVFYIENNNYFSFLTASSSYSSWDNSTLYGGGDTFIPDANIWTHIAVTRVGNIFTMYKNGVAVKSGEFSGPVENITTPLTIGKGHTTDGTPSQPFYGNIDDLIILSVGKSADEIQELYNSTEPVSSIEEYEDIDINSILNLSMWVKADAISGLSDGEKVQYWYNQSGRGNDLTQNTESLRPAYKTNILNGLPVVEFTAANTQYISNTVNYSSPVSVFVVERLTGGANNRLVSSITNNWLLGFWGGSNNQGHFDGWVTNAGGTPVDTDWHIHSAVIPGNSYSKVFGDGLLIASSSNGTTGPNGISLGGWANRECSNGQVAEYILVSGVVSDENRRNIEHYLSEKYSLDLSSSTRSLWHFDNTTTDEARNNSGCVEASSCVGSSSCSEIISDLSSVSGSNSWKITATDTAGNSTSSNITFDIDTSSPSGYIMDPYNTGYTTAPTQMYYEAYDYYYDEYGNYFASSGVDYVVATDSYGNTQTDYSCHGSQGGCSGYFSNLNTVLNSGNTWYLDVFDLAGNSYQTSVYFDHYTLPPSVTIDNPYYYGYYSGQNQLSYTVFGESYPIDYVDVVDSYGTHHLDYQCQNQSYCSASVSGLNYYTGSSNEWYIYVYDTSGNSSSASVYFYDIVYCSSSVISVVPSPTESQNPQFTFNVSNSSGYFSGYVRGSCGIVDVSSSSSYYYDPNYYDYFSGYGDGDYTLTLSDTSGHPLANNTYSDCYVDIYTDFSSCGMSINSFTVNAPSGCTGTPSMNCNSWSGLISQYDSCNAFNLHGSNCSWAQTSTTCDGTPTCSSLNQSNCSEKSYCSWASTSGILMTLAPTNSCLTPSNHSQFLTVFGTPTSTSTVSEINRSSAYRLDCAGAAFQANMNVTNAGTWTFAVDSDDAAEIEIDGTVVASWYGSHGMCSCYTYTGTINLTAGDHTFIARQVNGSGPEGIKVYFKQPGGTTWKLFGTSNLSGYATLTTGCSANTTCAANNNNESACNLITGCTFNNRYTCGGDLSCTDQYVQGQEACESIGCTYVP